MNTFIIIITGILGATSTFYVNEHLKQGAVRASALLSLCVSLFFYCLPDLLNSYLTQNIPTAFIGASFVGMVSSKAISHYKWLILAGIIFSIIYINKSTFFKGYGGALGTTAFIALLATMAIPVVFSRKKKITNGILIFRKWLFRDKDE
ncbi:hypothetical protein FNB79_14630 [Formosa sediminum]|uniref:Uncharacterized protein n=1 Tax=Formosa sediminum TaxID=2594004 RepID=A0A516GUH0_9FLAO|nr:hypothetical protein [Formosa sediminum]QDO95156.1 hypothetical protein FNB79_14630 [Formosa sediminum]